MNDVIFSVRGSGGGPKGVVGGSGVKFVGGRFEGQSKAYDEAREDENVGGDLLYTLAAVPRGAFWCHVSQRGS